MAHPHFCDCDPCLNGPRYSRASACWCRLRAVRLLPFRFPLGGAQ